MLGPSHHHYTRRCCLSPASSYATPLGKGCMRPGWNLHCFCICLWLPMCVPSAEQTGVPAVHAGNIPIDAAIYSELRATGEFDVMDLRTDEVTCRP